MCVVECSITFFELGQHILDRKNLPINLQISYMQKQYLLKKATCTCMCVVECSITIFELDQHILDTKNLSKKLNCKDPKKFNPIGLYIIYFLLR